MTIIAVDEDRASLEGIGEILRDAGLPDLRFEAFRSPKAALRFAEHTGCDVAFIALEMREMYGFFLAERLKVFNPRINLIFFSQSADQAERAFSMRASGYQTKPVTREKVLRELTDLRFVPHLSHTVC